MPAVLARFRCRWVLSFAACVAAAPCGAAVNKCTDARGRVTYQDEPCAARDERAKVETTDAVTTRRVPPPAGPAARASAPAITRALPAGTPASAARR